MTRTEVRALIAGILIASGTEMTDRDAIATAERLLLASDERDNPAEPTDPTEARERIRRMAEEHRKQNHLPPLEI